MAKIRKIKKVVSDDEKIRLEKLKFMTQEKKAIDRFLDAVFGEIIKDPKIKPIK
jgi:hypothetical protein